jgi:hypothetical protein
LRGPEGRLRRKPPICMPMLADYAFANPPYTLYEYRRMDRAKRNPSRLYDHALALLDLNRCESHLAVGFTARLKHVDL